MSYLSLFKMPVAIKITGRSSSITNAFINSIIPVVPPKENDVRQALSILGMVGKSLQCSYCGTSATEWDHLRPLVMKKKPTGYISEIHNLVPACGKCNQSKGNKNWREWMLSDAKLSPKSRQVPDIDDRIDRLEKYEEWGEPIKIDFERTVGKEIWEAHWFNCNMIQERMRKAQEHADKIKKLVDASPR